MDSLKSRILEKCGELPAWHDAAAVEDFCYALLEVVIAELEGPMGMIVTPVVAVYDDGEALLVLVATGEGDRQRTVTQASRWVNFKEQRVGEIIGEVEEIRQEALQSAERSSRRSYRGAPALP